MVEQGVMETVLRLGHALNLNVQVLIFHTYNVEPLLNINVIE